MYVNKELNLNAVRDQKSISSYAESAIEVLNIKLEKLMGSAQIKNENQMKALSNSVFLIQNDELKKRLQLCEEKIKEHNDLVNNPQDGILILSQDFRKLEQVF